MLYTTMKETPIGPLTLAARDGKICKLEFRDGGAQDVSDANPAPKDVKVLAQAVQELERYFRGDLRKFSVPVCLEGPKFHQKVWHHLSSIPYGQTEGYGEIARLLGSPGAARAVGNACAQNPVAVIVPCHRVLARGGLGGFGGGLDAKMWLLKHEGATLPKTS